MLFAKDMPLTKAHLPSLHFFFSFPFTFTLVVVYYKYLQGGLYAARCFRRKIKNTAAE